MSKKSYKFIGGYADGMSFMVKDDENSFIFVRDTITRGLETVTYIRRVLFSGTDKCITVFAAYHLSHADIFQRLVDQYSTSGACTT